MADEPEVHGLLALMLLLDARRGARFRDGELVLLADQDPRLLHRLGREEEPRSAYRRALELAEDAAERRLLERRLRR
jgi:RNA polymerase sigma-70 factor (ECF subfamily)